MIKMLTYKLRNHLKSVFRTPFHLALRGAPTIVLHAARLAHHMIGDAGGLNAKTLYPPQRHCASSFDWTLGSGKAHGAKIKLIDEPGSVTHPSPKTPHRAVRRQFQIDLVSDRPATFVATIPNGRVWGDGIVITPDDTVLDDVSVDFGPKENPTIERNWRLEKLSIFNARIAVLSTTGASIYFHWLFQLLPRVELIRRGGIPLDSVDYFLVNDLAGRYKHDSLKALGIPFEKVLLSSEHRYLQARELVVPSVVLGSGCYPDWMRAFLRKAFLGSADTDVAATPTRRLYLTRGAAKYRRVLNEEDVVERLKQYGFEIVRLEAVSLSEQAKLLSEAAVVVSPHGAGLGNVVFSRPGCAKVIEIFSPELVAGFYWRLCAECNLDYYYILGKGRPETLSWDYDQSWDARDDITVDLDLLAAVMDQAQIARP